MYKYILVHARQLAIHNIVCGWLYVHSHYAQYNIVSVHDYVIYSHMCVRYDGRGQTRLFPTKKHVQIGPIALLTLTLEDDWKRNAGKLQLVPASIFREFFQILKNGMSDDRPGHSMAFSYPWTGVGLEDLDEASLCCGVMCWYVGLLSSSL